MQQLNKLAFLMAILAAVACHSTKYTPANFPKEQLRFGSGGGFTGGAKTLVLLKNGQLFQKNFPETTFSEHPKIKKKEAKAFYEATAGLDLGTTGGYHPGNTYQFIEFQKDSTTVRATWGDEKFPVNQKVKDLFIALNGLVKTETKR